MTHRRWGLLLIVIALMTALGTSAALAQDPTIALTSPVSGEVLSSNPVGVTGTTSNAPPGGQVTVTLFSGASVVGSMTVALSETGSFSAAVSVSSTPADPVGVVRAELLDGSALVVASTQVNVTWPIAQPTATPTSTQTPTSAATATPTPTSTLPPTNAPTNTPTATFTPSVTFTPTVTGGAPLLVITSPANGSSVNVGTSITVTGTHLNLPVGAVIRANVLINNGTVNVGEGIVAPGSNGAWQVAFNLASGIPNNTPALVRATAQFGSGIVATSNAVNITLVSTISTPVIVINQPVANAVVGLGTTSTFVASGFSANIVGQINVRAVDAFGTILNQANVIPNADGSWAVTLTVTTLPGARGGVIAANADRSVRTRVDVTYGAVCTPRTDWFIYIVQPGDQLNRIASRTSTTVQDLAYANCIPNADLLFVGSQLRVPRLPVVTVTPTRRPPTPTATRAQSVAIRIDSPVANSQIATDSAVLVRGGGTNLAGRDLVVRAIAVGGRLLAQTNARADVNGNWQATLGGIVVNDTTPATLNVFTRSGAGVVLANLSINVTFLPTGVVPIGDDDTQRLMITSPAEGDQVSENGLVTVVGSVMGAFDGDVVVRALDPLGTVIDEQVAEVAINPNTGDAIFQIQLTTETLAGTYGTIFAYAAAPFGLDPALTDSIVVRYGDDPGQPYVTISDPAPYSMIDLNTPLVISGRGGRLFEGGLVVRVLDEAGTVIFEEPTTLSGPDAGVGGEGDWQIVASLTAEPGTRATILAVAESPRDGSIVAFASVNVTLGLASELPDFVSIHSPLPGTLIRQNEVLLIAGTADAAGSGSVRIRLLNDSGAMLLDQVRPVTIAAGDPVGRWQIAVELRGIAEGTALTFIAEAVASDGSVLSADQVGAVVGAAG